MKAFSQRLSKKNEERKEKPSEWLQRHFYIPEPVDPDTGELLPSGPIRFKDHQARIIDAALARLPNGLLKYSTVLYSTIKKSGKSTTASGVALYMGCHNPYSEIYCLANDESQANARLFKPIRTCIMLHKQLGGILKNANPSLGMVTLDNQTFIRSVPADAAGEAGSEPLLTVWSELWAYETELKRRLWIEMTVPPTKYGRALRWVETYAGYQGSSTLLWHLYESIIKPENRHPDFPDLPVYESGGMFAYWDTEPRFPWQMGEQGASYYAEEAKLQTPLEFQRVHRNQWVAPVGAFIQPGMWEACEDESILELTDPNVPVVVAIDAGVENDCSAMVAVSRHHLYPDTDISVRACKIFSPKDGGSIILPIERTLREWYRKWNIVLVAYDVYQMASLIHNFQQGNITVSEEEIRGMSAAEIEEYLKRERKLVLRWYYKFSQATDRAVADKRLYDMIVARSIHWNPQHPGLGELSDTETLTKHLKQAGAVNTKGQYRLQKLSQNSKIDAAVALSMAAERCMALNISNKETDEQSLIKSLMADKITYAQFTIAMKSRHTKVTS